MVGVKGRSGKVSTPEQAQRRAIVASKGGAARWAKADAEAKASGESIPPVTLTPEQDRAAAMAGQKLPAPLTWREACQRQQAGVAALKREKLQLEIEAMKRLRIPVAEVRDFLARVRALVLRELATLPGLAEKIPDARPYQIEALRRELSQFSEQYRKAITETDL